MNITGAKGWAGCVQSAWEPLLSNFLRLYCLLLILYLDTEKSVISDYRKLIRYVLQCLILAILQRTFHLLNKSHMSTTVLFKLSLHVCRFNHFFFIRFRVLNMYHALLPLLCRFLCFTIFSQGYLHFCN